MVYIVFSRFVEWEKQMLEAIRSYHDVGEVNNGRISSVNSCNVLWKEVSLEVVVVVIVFVVVVVVRKSNVCIWWNLYHYYLPTATMDFPATVNGVACRKYNIYTNARMTTELRRHFRKMLLYFMFTFPLFFLSFFFSDSFTFISFDILNIFLL